MAASDMTRKRHVSLQRNGARSEVLREEVVKRFKNPADPFKIVTIEKNVQPSNLGRSRITNFPCGIYRNVFRH